MSEERQRELANGRWLRSGGHKCRSCKTPVLFATNVDTGKRQIFDARPAGNGHFYIYGPDTALLATYVKEPGENRSAGVSYHVDHHATCPQADEWRKKKT